MITDRIQCLSLREELAVNCTHFSFYKYGISNSIELILKWKYAYFNIYVTLDTLIGLFYIKCFQGLVWLVDNGLYINIKFFSMSIVWHVESTIKTFNYNGVEYFY